MQDSVLFLFLGILVGLLSTFFGAGGGAFIVPILPLIYDIPLREVVPTSLITVLGVVVVNTIFFSKNNLVNWRSGFITGFSASIVAFFVSRLSFSLDPVIIQKSISYVLGLIALLLLFVRKKQNYFDDRSDRKSIITSLVVGIFAGGSQSLTGIGAGLLITPIYLIFNVVPYNQVVPTSNLCMIFTSIFSVIGYFSEVPNLSWPYLGLSRLDIALWIFVGTFITAPIGRKHQHRLPENIKKYILAFILLGLAIQVYLRNSQ